MTAILLAGGVSAAVPAREPYHGRKDMLMCAELPEDRRWFFTYRAHFADEKPQKAGLLGPARILMY